MWLDMVVNMDVMAKNNEQVSKTTPELDAAVVSVGIIGIGIINSNELSSIASW